MTVSRHILLFNSSNSTITGEIKDSIRIELQEMNISLDQISFKTVPQDFNLENINNLNGPKVGIVLPNSRNASQNLDDNLNIAKDNGIYLIPVASQETGWRNEVHPMLHNLNAIFWNDSDSRQEFVQTVLQEIGLQKDDRRVFLSYRREDSKKVAYQLREELTQKGYDVFLDEVSIRPGEDFQQQIHQAIDDKGFLLVLESPSAHDSEWIDEEVSHAMEITDLGLMGLTWPNIDRRIPSLKEWNGFSYQLSTNDFVDDDTRDPKLENNSLMDICAQIDRHHAQAINQRTEHLSKSLYNEFNDEPGYEPLVLQDKNILLVTEHDSDYFLGTSPRTPSPRTHHELYIESEKYPADVNYVVHLSDPSHERADLNDWVLSQKNQDEEHLSNFLRVI